LGDAVVVVEVVVVDVGVVVVVVGVVDVVVDEGVVVVDPDAGVDEVGGELEEVDVVVPPDDDDDEVDVEFVEEPGFAGLDEVVIKPLLCSCVSISC
jgi:hypothetical protein